MQNTSLIPKWMRIISDNPSLLSEFTQDMNQRESASIREGLRALKEGNTTQSYMLFGKAEAFESLRKSLQINLKESEAQNAFQSKQAGNTDGPRSRSSKGRSASR